MPTVPWLCTPVPKCDPGGYWHAGDAAQLCDEPGQTLQSKKCRCGECGGGMKLRNPIAYLAAQALAQAAYDACGLRLFSQGQSHGHSGEWVRTELHRRAAWWNHELGMPSALSVNAVAWITERVNRCDKANFKGSFDWACHVAGASKERTEILRQRLLGEIGDLDIRHLPRLANLSDFGKSRLQGFRKRQIVRCVVSGSEDWDDHESSTLLWFSQFERRQVINQYRFHMLLRTLTGLSNKSCRSSFFWPLWLYLPKMF